MEAFGLYTHIKSNQRRSVMLIIGLFLLAYLASFGIILISLGYMGGNTGDAFKHWIAYWPFITLGVGAWVFIGYKVNVGLIAMVTGAKGLDRTQEPRLYKMLENLCISRGMTPPKLMILESPALNAFASGTNEKQYTITLTRGLLDNLTDPEVEAVMAHELTHIRNDDVKLMIVAVVIAGVISFFGEMMFRGFRFGGGRSSSSSGDKKGGGALILIGIAILLIAWLLAIVLRFSLSRSREYMADAGAVELTKNPDAMISALLKISGRADIVGVPSGIMDMCIENDPDDLGDIFATHPSIAKRIQALTTMAGGRMPPDQKPAPPRVENRTPLPEEVESRGPWGKSTLG
ncbi:MAG: M48 family metallopeptidase [Bosea sp. (in: a-proteobacteria)]